MPIVAQFEGQLQRYSKQGLGRWTAVDLHNHSPMSHDFSGDRSTALEDAVRHLQETPVDIVMFTDHQRLPDRDFVESLAKQTGKTILRGCEFNVFVDAWDKPTDKVNKNIFFHLLVGFDPDANESPDYWFTHLHKECRNATRNIGGTNVTGFIDPTEHICGLLKDSGAIAIPAHLHTRGDATKSRSVDDIYTVPEFLRLAKEHFSALEVTDLKTAAYFDGNHAETNFLHKTCIRSSDAHQVTSIGRRMTYVQMERPIFSELKAGLELPFRVTLEPPLIADSYIHGINIRGQFFPDLWLSLSPHCNAFIGVKGSGKTSVLECLRFALGSQVPESRKDEVDAHLRHILGEAGSVQVLVKRADGVKVLVERTFSNPDRFRMTFEDDRVKEVRSAEALMFPSYVLGWHEIEQAATEPRIRKVYLNTIAGLEQIRQLQEDTDRYTSEIRRLHEQAARRYGQFRAYHDQVSRLEDLRAGLQVLGDERLIELRDEYETAIRQRQATIELAAKLRKAKDNVRERGAVFSLQLDSQVFYGSSPLAEVAKNAASIVKSLKGHVEKFVEVQEERLDSAISSAEDFAQELQRLFGEFSAAYEAKVQSLSPKQRNLLESHRKVLEDTRALPELIALKDGVRAEVEVLLSQLVNTCLNVAEALDKQTNLRTEKVNLLNEELKKYDVRLGVAPLSRNTIFEDLSQRSTAGANVFMEIQSLSPNEKRHHRRLAQAYRRLKEDLVDGYRLFFESHEFAGYLGAFEEDDLSIGLKVGKADQEYSPIDELSAGQRCTAVFPLLLRLQEGPLIVDQPEDNLDNRHIAQSIAPAILKDKRTRQIAFTSHNANLVVLADCELIAMFEGLGSTGKIEEQGFLCTSVSNITQRVIDILDGGDTALKLRYQKYGVVS